MPKEDTQFKPGQSGNPGGRPKGSLKSYIASKLANMTPKQKEAWLKTHKISGIDQWKMGEGNPDTGIVPKGSGTVIVFSIDE